MNEITLTPRRRRRHVTRVSPWGLAIVVGLIGAGAAIPDLTQQFPDWKWLWTLIGAVIVPAANQLKAAFTREPVSEIEPLPPARD